MLAVRLFASTLRPRIERPFTLSVEVDTAERTEAIPSALILPPLGGLEELGEVSAALPAPDGGTRYRETLRVVAHASGTLTLAPVEFDAVDARDGRPKRFLSDPLQLQIAGPLAPATRVPAGWFAVLAAVAAALTAALARRRGMQAEVPWTIAPQPALDRRETVDAALDAFRRERTRGAARHLRAALRRTCGIPSGWTLDLAARRSSAGPQDLRRLTALEHVCFAPAAQLPAAVEAALAAWNEPA